jgi:hypothetical protein
LSRLVKYLANLVEEPQLTLPNELNHTSKCVMQRGGVLIGR